MQLRVRGPQGQATVKVEPGTSVAAFKALLAESTGVPADLQQVRGGFPPKLLTLPADGTVADTGIQSGDSLTVTAAAAAAAAGAAATAPTAVAAAVAAAGGDSHLASVAHLTEDEQLARAIALSMGQEVPDLPATTAPPPPAPAPAPAAAAAAVAPPRRASPVRAHPTGPSSSSNGSAAAGAPSSVPLPDGTAVVRRVVDSDNSCLFNSVGYVTERSRKRAAHFRQVVAEAVLADPFEWSEAVLGKEPAEYCRWIKDPSKWGGAIELAILARHLHKEIAAFDIQTTRVDIYGEGQGYAERLMLIYDGLHYDALAVAAFAGAPEKLDVTAIPTAGARTDMAMEGAKQLTVRCNAARQFTDTANFTLRCGVCQIGLKGEKEAVEHAKTTGHTNFSEY